MSSSRGGRCGCERRLGTPGHHRRYAYAGHKASLDTVTIDRMLTEGSPDRCPLTSCPYVVLDELTGCCGTHP